MESHKVDRRWLGKVMSSFLLVSGGVQALTRTYKKTHHQCPLHYDESANSLTSLEIQARLEKQCISRHYDLPVQPRHGFSIERKTCYVK